MFRYRLFATGFLGLPIVLTFLAAAGDGLMAFPQDAATNWGKDFDQARLKARQTGRPLFVVFR